MTLQLGEIVEGIGPAQFGGVDQTHEQVTHLGAFLGQVSRDFSASVSSSGGRLSVRRLLSSRTEFITNDWPLEETMYCCLFWFIAVLPTFVLNSGTGAPISGLVPSEGRRMLTAISHSSDPI